MMTTVVPTAHNTPVIKKKMGNPEDFPQYALNFLVYVV